LSGIGGQPISANLTSLSGLSYVSGSFVKMTAAGTFTLDTNTYYLASNPSSFISLTALSSSATGLTYTNTTGVFSLTAGYVIPTTSSATNWDTAYTNRITSATAPLSITTNVISISQATTSTNGYLSSTDWNTFNNKTSNTGTVTSVSGTGTVSGLTLSGTVTTTGSLTLGGTLLLTSLNVTTALGFTPVTNARTLTINGTTYDLTADRTWTISTGISTLTTTGTSGPATLVGSTLNVPNYSAGASAVRNVSTFTATSGQTTFTITGGYTVGLIDVFINGARLSTADYTATNSSTVVLGTAAVLNDIVDVVNYTATFTAGISGTGTTNFLTKWTGTSTISNSLIFDNGTNIGINTSSPSSFATYFNLSIKGGSSGTNLDFFTSAGTRTTAMISDSSAFYIQNLTAIPLIFTTNNVERLRILSSGEIGIGTASPTEKLTVATAAGTACYVSAYNGTTSIFTGVNAAGMPIMYVGSANPIAFFTNAAERMRITSIGNIGFGTSSPSPYSVISVGPSGSLDGAYFTVGVSALVTKFSNTSNNPTTVRWSNYNGNFYDIQNNPSDNSFTFDYNDNERFRIASSGNIGINTSSPAQKLDVNGNICINDQQIRYRAGTDPNHATQYDTPINGPLTWGYFGAGLGYNLGGAPIKVIWNYQNSAYNYNNSTTWQQTSDIRIKENIRPISNVLDKLTSLNPVHFEFKTKVGITKTGFIAQEFEEVFPGHVTEIEPMGEYKQYFKDGEKIKSIDADLMPYIIKAIQELKSELDQLKAK